MTKFEECRTGFGYTEELTEAQAQAVTECAVQLQDAQSQNDLWSGIGCGVAGFLILLGWALLFKFSD